MASLVVETGSDPILMSDVQSGRYNSQLTQADEDCSTEILLGPAKPVHVTDAHDQSGHETETQGHSSVDIGNVVDTRAGRVSKKVNWLIESMARRPIIARDLASLFRRKSQSLLTLFSSWHVWVLICNIYCNYYFNFLRCGTL